MNFHLLYLRTGEGIRLGRQQRQQDSVEFVLVGLGLKHSWRRSTSW